MGPGPICRSAGGKERAGARTDGRDRRRRALSRVFRRGVRSRRIPLVREYNLPGQDRNLWTVFDPQGRVLGFVEMPFGAEVYEIGADYILGGTEDGLGVERVGLWPLDRVR